MLGRFGIFVEEGRKGDDGTGHRSCQQARGTWAIWPTPYDKLFIIRRIGDAGFSEGFLALYAGAAAATMLVATTIARPRLCVIDAQFLASGCYLALCHVAVG